MIYLDRREIETYFSRFEIHNQRDPGQHHTSCETMGPIKKLIYAILDKKNIFLKITD